MRFLAPGRETVNAEIFDRPVFSGLAEFSDLLRARQWPALADLNARLLPLQHRTTGRALAFVAQGNPSESLPYESRIFERGEIATRTNNWHDLLNALIWRKYPAIKSALNLRQAETIAMIGAKRRTREQDALTQFDEAGAVLVIRDRRLLALWDAHDWPGLFLREREAWRDGRIALTVFGHALLEHALHPGILLVAKALVLFSDEPVAPPVVEQRIADAIVGRQYVDDPQRLRPLPLSGIPGWHGATQDDRFYAETACFRPLRAGRCYVEPLSAMA
jgi:hypothetical protein